MSIKDVTTTKRCRNSKMGHDLVPHHKDFGSRGPGVASYVYCTYCRNVYYVPPTPHEGSK